MQDINDINRFIRGGLAIGTLSNKRTGKHFTFQFELAKQTGSVERPPAYFVSVLAGPDNTRDYSYMGMLFENADKLRLTKGSKVGSQAASMHAVNWLLRRKGDLPKGVNFEHMGKCSACNLPLTNPESLRVGMGPTCRSKV